LLDSQAAGIHPVEPATNQASASSPGCLSALPRCGSPLPTTHACVSLAPGVATVPASGSQTGKANRRDSAYTTPTTSEPRQTPSPRFEGNRPKRLEYAALTAGKTQNKQSRVGVGGEPHSPRQTVVRDFPCTAFLQTLHRKRARLPSVLSCTRPSCCRYW
jgi:hypothetical protein